MMYDDFYPMAHEDEAREMWEAAHEAGGHVLSPSEFYQRFRVWRLNPPDPPEQALHLTPLRFFRVRLELPDGSVWEGPRFVGGLSEVPEAAREAFLEQWDPPDPESAAPIDPWTPLEPDLWGSEPELAEKRRARVAFWDARMAAAGFAETWPAAVAAMRAGELNEEVLLDLILRPLGGGVPARSVVAAVQVLSSALQGWMFRMAVPPFLSWEHPVGPHPHWDAPALWGRLRGAVASEDWAGVLAVLEEARPAFGQPWHQRAEAEALVVALARYAGSAWRSRRNLEDPSPLMPLGFGRILEMLQNPDL